MHQLSKFVTILAVLVFMLSIPLLLNTKYDTAIQQENTHVKATLTNAAYDAVQTITLVDGKAFGTPKQIHTALDAFYTSLSAGYYSVLGVDNTLLNAYLPFVMLIDNDGVYVCYALNYSDYWGDGATMPDSIDERYYLTPLTSYAATYTQGASDDVYVVQFTLGDHITIYTNGRVLVEGGYSHVKSVLDAKYPDAIESLPFLTSEKMLIDERQEVVTNTVSRLINKYLNEDVHGNDNVGFNLMNTQYYFELPTSQQTWQNALSGPTVVSFYHGPQKRLNHTSVAQVVFAGGELAKETHYYVTIDGSGNKYYHTKDCENLTEESITVNTMEEAALVGAYPDPDCIY